MQERMKRNLNIPNALTLVRLLLIPVYWVLMMVRDDEQSALIVFIVASVTDLLDGYIARRYNLTTDLGKLFDPLADKLMVLSVMLSLVIKDVIPWPFLLTILLKESLMIVGGALMLHHQVVVYAKPIGKIAQFFIVVGLILSFFRAYFGAFPWHLALLAFGMLLTLGALVYYGVSCIRAIRAKDKAMQPTKEDR